MEKRWNTILVIFLILIVLSTVYYIGYTTGLRDAMVSQQSLSSVTDGLSKIVILTAIREGKTDQAIELLELSLDGDIIKFSKSGGIKFPFTLSFLRANSHYLDTSFMNRITKYRKEHPTPLKDPVTKSYVEKALVKFNMVVSN